MKTREHISVTTMYPPRGKGRGFYILSPSISSLLFFFLPFVSDAFQMEGDGNSCTRSLRPRARPPSCRLILPISIIYEDTIGCMCSLVALSLQQFFPFFFFPPICLYAEVNDRAISRDAIHIQLFFKCCCLFLFFSPHALQ